VRAGTLAALAVGMIIFGPVVLLAQYVQIAIAFTATLAGLLILLRAIPVIILTPIISSLVSKVDPRYILTTGLVISAASFWELSLRMTTGSDFSSLAGLMVVSGIGQSMLLVPTLYSVLGSVPAAESPRVSPFISLSVQLGGSIASAGLIAFSDTRTFFHSEIYRSAITLSNGAVTNLLDKPHGLALLNRVVQGEAVNAGFADALLSLVAIAALALIPVWLLRPPRAPQHVDLAVD
jgi:DHA2 family multidrug resistance protein